MPKPKPKKSLFDAAVSSLNDAFQQADNPHAAAEVLLALKLSHLRGLCDLNHVEPSMRADTCRKRLINDRWPDGCR